MTLSVTSLPLVWKDSERKHKVKRQSRVLSQSATLNSFLHEVCQPDEKGQSPKKKFSSTKHWGHQRSALFETQWARSGRRRQLLDIFTLRHVGGNVSGGKKRHGFPLEINCCIQLSGYSEAAACTSWPPLNGSFKCEQVRAQLWLRQRQWGGWTAGADVLP